MLRPEVIEKLTNKKECKHEWIYANFTYATNPPRTPRICKLCGEERCENDYELPKPEDTYDGIKEKFRKLREDK